MERKFRITIDTYLDPAINVHLNDGTNIMFNLCRGGIYYYGTTNMEHYIINSRVTGCTFMNTVESNKVYFHER